MAKTCSNCDRVGSVVEEQKSKIQLLETRLAEVLRAYKLMSKEKEKLMNINASITADVDSTQQKRIADLEESVLHMSSMCGKFELERKKDREQIALLEAECERLHRQVETISPPTSSSQLPGSEAAASLSQKSPPKECRNKACQTEAPTVIRIVEEGSRPVVADRCTQTNVDVEDEVFILEQHQRRAVVAPVKRVTRTVSEATDSSLDDHELIDITVHRVAEGEHGRGASTSEADPSLANSGTSLFYINELARRELELAEYKLRVREHECSIRELQWKYSNEKYRLQSRIADLELLNSNFLTSKTDRTVPTSTVNVAYIRNVLTKLLETKDKEQKQIMINALLTALSSLN